MRINPLGKANQTLIQQSEDPLLPPLQPAARVPRGPGDHFKLGACMNLKGQCSINATLHPHSQSPQPIAGTERLPGVYQTNHPSCGTALVPFLGELIRLNDPALASNHFRFVTESLKGLLLEHGG